MCPHCSGRGEDDGPGENWCNIHFNMATEDTDQQPERRKETVRSGEHRRREDRRKVDVPVEHDRRSGLPVRSEWDRRKGDRRQS